MTGSSARLIVLFMFALGAAGEALAQFPPKGEQLDLMLLGSSPEEMARANNYGGIIYPMQEYLRQHPNSWGSRWNLAGAYYALGRLDAPNYDKALEAYGILLKDMPQRPELLASVHFWRARSYLAKGDFTKAHEAFTTSLAQGDLRYIANDNPYLYAGQGAFQAGAFEAALPLFDKYVAGTGNAGNKSTGLLWKSKVLRSMKQAPEALAAVQASAEQHLKLYRRLFIPILVQRAECSADLGDKEHALNDLDVALKQDPIGDEDKRLLERARVLRAKLTAA